MAVPERAHPAPAVGGPVVTWFLAICGFYAVGGAVLVAVAVALFWEDWRG